MAQAESRGDKVVICWYDHLDSKVSILAHSYPMVHKLGGLLVYAWPAASVTKVSLSIPFVIRHILSL